jgi:hypothetical protein
MQLNFGGAVNLAELAVEMGAKPLIVTLNAIRQLNELSD